MTPDVPAALPASQASPASAASPGARRRAAVITCSDSISAGRGEDRSGPLAVAGLSDLGFAADVTVVPDERDQIAAAVAAAVAAGAQVVVTTGGTGLGPRDVTPEALADLCDKEIPGIGEALRATARGRVPQADLSRSGAWTLSDAVVVALPGSTGGVRDGLAVVGPLLAHALDMMAGGGHGGHSGHGEHPGHSEHGTGHPPAPSGSVALSEVTDAVIDPARLSWAVADPAAGAVVDFAGRVRDHDHDRQVRSLRYEAHPDAARLLGEVLADACDRRGVIKVAAAHRVGDLDIGELAFAVAVSAPHRAEAFETAAWLVDEIKERLPVWKRQVFADGSHEWVNCA